MEKTYKSLTKESKLDPTKESRSDDGYPIARCKWNPIEKIGEISKTDLELCDLFS